jgi:Domain of unknown function (DUF222)
MLSMDRGEIVSDFDALMSWLMGRSFETLTTPDRLALLERCETVRRQLPAIEHELINSIAEQADATELDGTLPAALADRLRITRGEAARRVRLLQDRLDRDGLIDQSRKASAATQRYLSCGSNASSWPGCCDVERAAVAGRRGATEGTCTAGCVRAPSEAHLMARWRPVNRGPVEPRPPKPWHLRGFNEADWLEPDDPPQPTDGFDGPAWAAWEIAADVGCCRSTVERALRMVRV